ncbi:glycosyltransferase family 2 protein [Nesterenkonia jeotgali]|uniref:glycosyltransferase family 2 protein n=1 Tax=Nesterenkonia jeotgali TaxID=317018 RepID=UPI0009F99698|nr:glycosyltransferase [Nesterenkonia jeotgali]
MPKVSVVTGYYNRVHLLERTIESILSQTFFDFELIVFDDNSTDGTQERLRQLSDEYKDPRFRYILHSENKGFVRGLVDAISTSEAEYIAIQGSGDVALTKRLELQVELMDRQPEVGAVGGWYFNVQEEQGTHRLTRPDANGMTFDDLLHANVFSHGEVMIRRSTYDLVGGYRPEFKYAQDRDLWLRISKVAQLATVPEPIYKRFVQFDGVSYVPSKRISQACYSMSAVDLAQMEPSEEAAALSRMRDNGPTSIVSVADSRIQSNLERSAIRMILFGSPDDGIELAETAIDSQIRRAAVTYFGKFMRTRVSGVFHPAVRKFAGIQRA